MSGLSRIHARHAIDAVEAAYSLDGSDEEWLTRLVDATRADLDCGVGTYALTSKVSGASMMPLALAQRGVASSIFALVQSMNEQISEGLTREMLRYVTICGGIEDLMSTSRRVHAEFQQAMAPAGVVDGFTLFAQDGEQHGITVSALALSKVTLTPRVRGIWRRVGLHIGAAYRLRQRLAAERAERTEREALFRPDGRVEDASCALADDRDARDAIVEGIKRAELARSSQMRRSPEQALVLWQGLVSGAWSLVDHYERGGRRYIAVFRNQPGQRDPRALNASERAVLSYAARGASNKEISFALGIPLGSVAAAVSGVIRKFACKHRSELVAFLDPTLADAHSLVFGDTSLDVLTIDTRPSAAATERLSEAEREVARLLLEGKSNQQIALARLTSVNTVANQLRTMFGKFGVNSRNELVRRLLVQG